MTDTNENSIIPEQGSEVEESEAAATEVEESEHSHSHHTDSEHHHHHHHHHTDGEHHHHHTEGETQQNADDEQKSSADGKRHHHHHHHHHSSSKKSNTRKKRRGFKGIRSTLKRLFLKVFSGKNEKNETDRQRLLKRSLFLIFMFVIFSLLFYVLVIDNINGSDASNARKSSSEIDQLKRQISQYQIRVKSLENELQAYKDAFGELDLSAVENKQ